MTDRPLTHALLTVALAFARAHEIELSIVSRRAVGDSRVLPRLRDGVSAPTLATADAALSWFSENWPADLDWPADVARPAPAASRAPIVSPVIAAGGEGASAVSVPEPVRGNA
jgi:hypothetical protein